MCELDNFFRQVYRGFRNGGMLGISGMSGMLRISVDTERYQVGEFRNVGNVSNVENVRRDRKT